MKRLRSKEHGLVDTIGTRIKLIERAGTSLKHKLWIADPWGGVPCRGLSCPVCTGDQENQICCVRNIIYTNSCITCKEKGTTALYVGETSRTLKERSLEHREDGEKEFTHIYNHKMEIRPSEEMLMK